MKFELSSKGCCSIQEKKMTYPGRGFGYMKNLPAYKPAAPVSNINDNDDLWGEDLPMEVLDEVVDIATQIELSQCTAPKPVLQTQSINNIRTNAVSSVKSSVPAVPKPQLNSIPAPRASQHPSVSKSHSFPNKSPLPPQFAKNGQKTPFESASAANLAIAEEISVLQEEVRKLKEENKSIVEENFAKIGETTILRTEIQKLRATEEALRAEKQAILDQLKHKTDLQHLEHVKEVETLKTDLLFKDKELENLREKCKKIEQGRAVIPVQKPEHNRRATYSPKSAAFLNNSRNAFDTGSEVKAVKQKSKAVQADQPRRFCLQIKYPIRSPFSRIQDSKVGIEKLSQQVLTCLEYDDIPSALKAWHERPDNSKNETLSTECNPDIVADLVCDLECTLALLGNIYVASTRNPDMLLLRSEEVLKSFVITLDKVFSGHKSLTTAAGKDYAFAVFSIMQQSAYFLLQVLTDPAPLLNLSRLNLPLKRKMWSFLRAFPDPKFKERLLELSPAVLSIPS